MHLESLELGFEGFARRQQRRHYDHGSQARGHAVAQRQARQHRCAEAARDRAIHQGDCHVDCRNQAEERTHHQMACRSSQHEQRSERNSKNDRCDCEDRGDVTDGSKRFVEAPEPVAQRRAIANDAFERATPASEQVISRVALADRIWVANR